MSYFQIIIIAATTLLCLTYASIIGLFTKGWFRLHVQSPTGTPPSLMVTIIIAVRNEAFNLSACLGAIAVQDYPRHLFEVIVVDDHSEDGTGDLVRQIISDNPAIKIKLLTLQAGLQGKKAAISQAVFSAAGEWIVTTDADCIMGKEWLTTMIKSAEDERLEMILAPVIFNREKSVFGQLQELEFMSLMASSAGAASSGLPIMCNGANLAYRKNAFLEINGYSTDREIVSGDDMFLMMNLRKAYGSGAIRFIKSPLAIVTTPASATFPEFINQRLRWVSKSRGYRDAWVLFTSALVFFFSLCTVISMVAWASGYTGPIIPAAFLSVKLLADFPLMTSFVRFTGRSCLMLWYVPLQIIYVFYVTFFGTFGNILSYRWKGRELR